MKSVDSWLKQHSRWSLEALLPVLRSGEQLTQGHTTQGCVRKAALFRHLPADNLVTWWILPRFRPPWVWRGTHTRLNDQLWACSLSRCTWRNKSKQTHRDTLKDTFSRSREEKTLKHVVCELWSVENTVRCAAVLYTWFTWRQHWLIRDIYYVTQDGLLVQVHRNKNGSWKDFTLFSPNTLSELRC